jgi:copper chaperone CopZ
MPEVVLDVEMACSGCSGAVERVLKKLEGRYSCTAGLYLGVEKLVGV